MNAAPAHVQFYIRGWTQVLPDARILVVLGTIPDMVYLTTITQKRNLGPVLSALRAEPGSPLYMHLFSNAGANSGAVLLRAFQESSANQKDILPLKGIVLDSAPSRGDYENAYAGLIYQVPRSPLFVQYLGATLVHTLVVIAFILEALSRKLNVLSQSSSDLNNIGIVPAGIPRIYCYSKEDLLVKWEDVEYHANIAEGRGWAVQREKFHGSDHCRHGKGSGEERYWKCIRNLVDRT